MFQSISFAGLKKSKLYGYAADAPFFKGRKSVAFKPGLNILFGPNGCGKTTLLRMLGDTMCATQGGLSAITEESVRQTIDVMGGIGRNSRGGQTDAIGLKVQHDGQSVLFADPRQTVGLSGGGFDDSFFKEGMVEAMSRGRSSHGQNSARRVNTILAVTNGVAQAPSAVLEIMKKGQVGDIWKEAIGLVEKRMVGTIPRGQQSILLDEPEANFSLHWQSKLWGHLADPALAERMQIIVASHSVFALGIPHANYVEFESGYTEVATEALRKKAQQILG